MSGADVFKILEKYNLGTFMDFDLYKRFSKENQDEEFIISKILEYKKYLSENKNKYSEEVMRYLRQRRGLDEYDLKEDEDINSMSSNEVFEEVLEWNGLLGTYADKIKDWIKDIYNINLNDINK